MNLCAENITTGHMRIAPVLRDLTASFEPGRMTAVVGPNGAGKSTLLQALAGQLRVWKGCITLDGQALTGRSHRDIASTIAVTTQRPQVAAPFSVRKVVSLGRYAVGPDPAAVDRAIARMNLSEHADQIIQELSVGQQQRVTLARALAQLEGGAEKRVLLADEPTAAMDPRFEVSTMSALRDLARTGAIVVVVMHGVDLALREADDALVLTSEGGVDAAGPVRDTLTPERLARVFETPFVEVESGDCRTVIPAAVRRD